MTVAQMESMEVMVPAALVAQTEVVTRPEEIGAAIGKALGALYAAIGRSGSLASGPPRVIYTAWGADEVRCTVAAPIDHAPVTPLDTDDVSIAELPAKVALRFVHRGPYRDIRTTYNRIESWLRERGGITTPADWARYSPIWEEYVTDPATTPESDLETRIFLPLRDQ